MHLMVDSKKKKQQNSETHTLTRFFKTSFVFVLRNIEYFIPLLLLLALDAISSVNICMSYPRSSFYS